MTEINWVLAALFLPLFPMAMLFNALFQRCRSAWLRIAMLLIWPMPGLWILRTASAEIPQWIIYWAMFSAILYGFRSVVVKEFAVWIGFFATSAWSLSWVAIKSGVVVNDLILHVLAFALPLALLTLLVHELHRRYDSAYAGIISGMAQVHPRLAGLFVVVMLAVIGSPLFPAFFSMLDTIAHSISFLPLMAVGVVVLWLLWSWSGIRLLQELLVGPVVQVHHEDVSYATTMAYSASIVALVISGLYISRVLI